MKKNTPTIIGMLAFGIAFVLSSPFPAQALGASFGVKCQVKNILMNKEQTQLKYDICFYGKESDGVTQDYLRNSFRFASRIKTEGGVNWLAVDNYLGELEQGAQGMNGQVQFRVSPVNFGYNLNVNAACLSLGTQTDDDPFTSVSAGGWNVSFPISLASCDYENVMTQAEYTIPFILCRSVPGDPTDPASPRGQCIACAGENTELDESRMWTALGCIETTGNSIIIALVQIGLGIAGGVLLLMTLGAAFLLSTSQGDPKKTEEAQKMITAGIVGILFIIFSVVVLRTVGVDILRIPGF